MQNYHPKILFKLFLVIPALISAASIESTKVDSILEISKEINANTNKIHENTRPHSGIDNKNFGIEFDPAMALLLAGDGVAIL